MCRCRDTGAKRCRWLFSTPEPYSAGFAAERKAERLATRRDLARGTYLEDAA
jgi:hypothetical protein